MLLRVDEHWHGTITGYTYYRCKCAECRAEWAAYNLRKRRERRAAGLCVECNTPAIRARCPRHLARHAERGRVGATHVG